MRKSSNLGIHMRPQTSVADANRQRIKLKAVGLEAFTIILSIRGFIIMAQDVYAWYFRIRSYRLPAIVYISTAGSGRTQRRIDRAKCDGFSRLA